MFVTGKGHFMFLDKACLFGMIFFLKKVLKHPHFSLLSYISLSFLYFLLKTVCLRSRCRTVKVTLQMQMTTLVAMATQHPDLKLFTVALPW